MPTEGVNMEALLERVIQMNMLIIEELHQQRKQMQDQQTLISSRLVSQTSSIATSGTNESSIDPSSRLINKINVKPKEYNGTNDENVVTWLVALEEVMANRLIVDDERISLAVSLLGGTALQWFVNMKMKDQRPTSWIEFKHQLTSQFQPVDFQENLRQQLLQLRQKQSLQDYVYKFRSIVGQIHAMDELSQVMLFVNGLAANSSLYVRSKHPQTVEAAIREATTYDNVTTISKNTHVKYDPFLETSSNVELNALHARQQRSTLPHHATAAKEDCFKLGLCFYCKEPGHRALQCPKRPPSRQSQLKAQPHSKNDQW